MVDYNSLYFGKVIFDTDLLSEADDRPYNRVKVLINGVTGIENESFTQPRGQNNPNRLSNPGLEIVGEEFYAYVLQPVMGNSSGVRYNATKDIVSVNVILTIKLLYHLQRHITTLQMVMLEGMVLVLQVLIQWQLVIVQTTDQMHIRE